MPLDPEDNPAYPGVKARCGRLGLRLDYDQDHYLVKTKNGLVGEFSNLSQIANRLESLDGQGFDSYAVWGEDD